MSPDEFFFLALGLVLGIAVGAAVLDVLRAQPPKPAVRLTITHNALPPRGLEPDRSLRAAELAPPEPPGQPPFIVRSAPAPVPPLVVKAGGAALLDPGNMAPGHAPAPAGRMRERVPLRVSRGVDPTLAALRAVARERAPVAVRSGTGEDRPRSLGAPQEGMNMPGPDPIGSPASAIPDGHRDRGDAGQAGRPCAAERLLAEERCAVAAQARERAEQVAAELRDAQRAYDEATSRAEAAARASDPRAVAEAKEAARRAFRMASAEAHDRHGLEAAATTWLGEINRINQERREASEQAAQARAVAAAHLTSIERLTLNADASRITAEAAASACSEARQILADCEEAALAPPRPAAATATGAGPGSAAEPVQPRPAAWTYAPDFEEEAPAAALASAGVGDRPPAIFRLLQGDRGVVDELADSLADGSADDRQRYQVLIGQLVAAIVAGAIESAVLEFPLDHPFWADFTIAQSRDIAVALASLGYRFDGLGGFADERVPSQRDLSLAVGYAGLDPMRIRRWPTEAQIAELYRGIRVAADEYLAARAPDLSLGEMVALLGPRSEPLAELWNAWGRARPLLLAIPD